MAKTSKKVKAAKRRCDQLRPIRIVRRFTEYPGGSVLIEMGKTAVLCTANIVNDLPRWRAESGLGWVTAEHSTLPGATPERKPRPRWGHTDGRGTEIQRLIGRVLRSVVDFARLGANTIYLDCDVLQADGGTRTAAINGGYVALVDAVQRAVTQGLLDESPVTCCVAAVSVGLVKGRAVLDLDYQQDSTAEVDLNVAMMDTGEFVELQGTAEGGSFSQAQLEKMLKLAQRGISQIMATQAHYLQRRK